MSILTFFRSFLIILTTHIRLLYLNLDPVKDAQTFRISKDQLLYEFRVTKAQRNSKPPPPPSHTINQNYLFPLLVCLYIYVDSFYMWSQNNFLYDPHGMPKLFFHRAFPKPIWPISDVIIGVAFLLSTTIYLCLVVDVGLNRKYLMYLFIDQKTGIPEIIQNGRTLAREVAIKMYKYRKTAQRLIPITTVVFFTIPGIIFSFNFTSAWSGILHDYVLLGCTPLFIFYACYTNVFMVLYFAITSRYIQIKQNNQSRRLNRLATVVTVKIAKCTVYKSNRNRTLWVEFWRLNRESSGLYEEIRGQNTFWSKYLTIFFIFYTVLICYLTYTFFFASADLGLQKHIFSLFGVDFAISLLFITLQCSTIVYQNAAMHRQRQRLLLRFPMILNRVGVAEALKVDQLAAEYRNVTENCFKLTTGYEINSKMFQMLLTYSSILFMMLFKRQERL